MGLLSVIDKVSKTAGCVDRITTKHLIRYYSRTIASSLDQSPNQNINTVLSMVI